MDWNASIPTDRIDAILVPFALAIGVALVARFTIATVRRTAPVVTGDYVVLRASRWAWVPIAIAVVGGCSVLPIIFDPGVPRVVACVVCWPAAVILSLVIRRDFREEYHVGSSELVRIAPSGRRTTVRWKDVRAVGYLPGKFSHFYVEAGDRVRTRLRISALIQGTGDLARLALAHAPSAAFSDEAATRVMRRYASEAEAERAGRDPVA